MPLSMEYHLKTTTFANTHLNYILSYFIHFFNVTYACLVNLVLVFFKTPKNSLLFSIRHLKVIEHLKEQERFFGSRILSSFPAIKIQYTCIPKYTQRNDIC